jgi:hypothetical protein
MTRVFLEVGSRPSPRMLTVERLSLTQRVDECHERRLVVFAFYALPP